MRYSQAVCLFAFAARGVLASAHQDHDTKSLPVVDLGYELYRASTYNATTDVFKFANIRYGQAPTKDLRFQAPLPPLTNRSAIQDGPQYRACPQGVPLWQAKAYLPIGKYTGAAPFSLEAWVHDIATSPPPPGLLESMNDKTSEDCLFLDVHVPAHTFHRSRQNAKFTGAPVLVWIHGGGFVLGAKTGHPNPSMNPDGLLAKAKKWTDDGVIFVALNYRLGALGFLAGPEVAANGTLNAGLLDQRLALDWVQEHIRRFGGDAGRVTVMGESAGGGSALYHMAARGGADGSAPFTQVIAQSPATIPRGVAYAGAYAAFLQTLGVDTLEQARQLPEREVILGNQKHIGAASANTYLHGPVVDGLYVPDEVGAMFRTGAFDRHVQVMTAKNSFEGGFAFDPAVVTDADFRRWASRSIAGLSGADVDYLVEVLYPPRFDGSLPYVDQATRQMALWGEAIVDCSFFLANEALGGNTFAYQFSVSPGIHTQDLKYTFDDHSTPPPRDTLAKKVLQEAIVSFVATGVPETSTHPRLRFPRWGSEQAVMDISAKGASITGSGLNATRCAWWHSK